MQAEKFPERHDLSHMAISHGENVLAGISSSNRKQTFPSRTINRTPKPHASDGTVDSPTMGRPYLLLIYAADQITCTFRMWGGGAILIMFLLLMSKENIA
jgi:hypothetical protein